MMKPLLLHCHRRMSDQLAAILRLIRRPNKHLPSLIVIAYRYDQNVLLSKRYVIFVLSLNKTSVITLF